MPSYTFTSDGNHLLNAVPGVASADGLALTFTISGTTSGVLAVNTAPPGSAVSLSNIAYLNGSLVPQSAGTAITSTGLVYVTADQAARGDLYLVLNWTSGETVVNVAGASLGNAGGDGGPVSAGDVTAGTFGANVGDVGDYAVPDDFTVADLLTTNGTTAALVQSGTTGLVNIGASANTGDTAVNVRAATGTNRDLRWSTGANLRWVARTNSTTEAGANAGSDWSLRAYDDAGTVIDAPLSVVRAASGNIYTAAGRPVSIGGASAGAATDTKITKAVTAIPNNTATTVLTITVPNAAHSATVRVTAIGALGAGGAIGAGEAVASNSYDITVVRTAGVNAVADISTAYGVNAAAVAGAATCTAALTVAAVSGAVGAINTFPVQISIVRSGGSSDNHTCVLVAEVLNANAAGITVA